MQEIRRWPLDYAILCVGAGTAIALFFVFWPDTVKQNNAGMALGLFYTFWGIGHHWHTKTLTGKIMVEYAAFGLLVSLLIWLGLTY
jgi:hypothetical protein